MTILIFILILFVLVLVHEFGHFIVAKKTGMRVDEFGIGFPPKLFGWKKGETEYSLNALPIGGFVRIYGEDPAAVSGDASRAFGNKSKLAQTAVLIAGVAANVLLAWALFSAAYLGGVETVVAPEEAGPAAALALLDVLPGSPAAEAGLLPNDRIVSLENRATGAMLADGLTPESVSAFIAASGGQAVSIVYLRRGERMAAEVVPVALAAGGEAEERPRVGVVMGLVETMRYSVPAALARGFTDTYRGLAAIVVGVSTLVAGAVTGTADFSQVAGPVGIAGLAGEASRFGFSALLIFTAFISLNLAIINLLPLPALDGGRLVMVAIEAVRRRPIRPSTARIVNTFGFLLILLLMVVVTWNDIVRL